MSHSHQQPSTHPQPRVSHSTRPVLDGTRSHPSRSDNTGPGVGLLVQRAQAAPQTLTPGDVQTLQRAIGNRATGRLLQPVLQAKMTLGPAGDRYEQEADRVADQVVRSFSAPAANNPVQRGSVEEEELQMKPLATPLGQRVTLIQRKGFQPPSPQLFAQRESDEEEELLQGQRDPTHHGPEGGEVDASVAQQIQRAKGGGSPLDDGVRAKMESGFGADFSRVRVHTGSQADTLNRSLNARAFTSGRDIFFGRGQYNPGSTGGQTLLAHELTHTVQQGAAQPATGAQRAVLRSTVQRFLAPANPAKAQLHFNRAVTRQTNDRAKLLQYVQQGQRQDADRRLKNACSMVLSGDLKLYALTYTGDSGARVRRDDPTHDPADWRAMFPQGTDRNDPGDIASPQVAYNWQDLDDNTNVEIDDDTTLGWELPGLIAMVDAGRKSRDEVWETLRHEGQHATDSSGNSQWEGYKTEFRAYWYEGGDMDQYSETKIINRAGYDWIEKQFHVFEQIYGGYDHTEQGWDNNPNVPAEGGISFRDAVIRYRDPDDKATNKYDSWSVYQFYERIKNLGPGEADVRNAGVQALLTAAAPGPTAISDEDAAYILFESIPQFDALATKLAGAAREAVLARLFARTSRSAGLLNFYKAMMGVPDGTGDVTHAGVQALLTATAPDAMSTADARYLYLQNKTSIQLLSRKLSGDARKAVLNRLSARTGQQTGKRGAEAFRQLLDATPLETHNVAAPAVQNLLGAAAQGAMEASTATYILNNYQVTLQKHLLGTALDAVLGRLRTRSNE